MKSIDSRGGVHIHGPATPRDNDWFWREKIGGFSTLGKSRVDYLAPDRPYVYGASPVRLRPVVSD